MKYFIFRKNKRASGRPQYIGVLHLNKEGYHIKLNILSISQNEQDRKSQEKIFMKLKSLLQKLDCFFMESK